MCGWSANTFGPAGQARLRTGAVPTYTLLCMRGNQSVLLVKERTVCFFGSRSSIAIHISNLSRLEHCLLVSVTSLVTPYHLAACMMSSGSGTSTSTTVSTASALSAGGCVSPTTPTSTTLSPAVVSLLGSLVRNIVRSEMVSGHSPAGSVPAIPSAPLLVPTGSSSAPVVLSSTTPAGITSGMPCYSVSVMLGHPPTSIEFLPSNHNWSGYFYNKIKNKSKKEEACMTEGLYYWMGQVCLCGMA